MKFISFILLTCSALVSQAYGQSLTEFSSVYFDCKTQPRSIGWLKIGQLERTIYDSGRVSAKVTLEGYNIVMDSGFFGQKIYIGQLNASQLAQLCTGEYREIGGQEIKDVALINGVSIQAVTDSGQTCKIVPDIGFKPTVDCGYGSQITFTNGSGRISYSLW